MRILRFVVAAALCVAAALVIRQNVVARYQCSVEKKVAELWLDSARESGSIERRLAVARGLIPRLTQCVEADPSDHEALFLLAVARMDADQHQASLATFQAALTLQERPETYTNIGLLQLEAGRGEEARRNLLRAAYFNIMFTGDVDSAMAAELYAEVEKRMATLRERASK